MRRWSAVGKNAQLPAGQERGGAGNLSCGLSFPARIIFFITDEEDWKVSYYDTEICRNKGSTVFIWCSYDYPTKLNRVRTTVEKSFWFIETAAEPVDLKEDPKFKDRVTYSRYGEYCDLQISEVRESDSGVYRFMFITNHKNRSFTGEPGVTLTVEELQVQFISRSEHQEYSDFQLKCFIKCDPNCLYEFVWFINGEETRSKIPSKTSQMFTFRRWTSSTDRISCDLRYYRMVHRSPEVYPPQNASVSVSPSAEILEGSSVTLTCSSDANPAANYTWFKDNQNYLNAVNVYHLPSININDSGIYVCKSENKHGWINSSVHIDVLFTLINAPIFPSASISGSGQILEGHSVTLTCSSDANPAANYTWFKENKDSLKSEEQMFTISDITAEDGRAVSGYLETKPITL
uniref:Ig-like domain-containing protein n=1 Tax=Oryzias latipes TaxID=8090 RepID=A0A3P9JP55_ORYLA